jgi:hypothetical protein
MATVSVLREYISFFLPTHLKVDSGGVRQEAECCADWNIDLLNESPPHPPPFPSGPGYRSERFACGMRRCPPTLHITWYPSSSLLVQALQRQPNPGCCKVYFSIPLYTFLFSPFLQHHSVSLVLMHRWDTRVCHKEVGIYVLLLVNTGLWWMPTANWTLSCLLIECKINRLSCFLVTLYFPVFIALFLSSRTTNDRISLTSEEEKTTKWLQLLRSVYRNRYRRFPFGLCLVLCDFANCEVENGRIAFVFLKAFY